MENKQISADEQEVNNLCFAIGDREHMILVFRDEITRAHARLGELRVKFTAERQAADAAQSPPKA